MGRQHEQSAYEVLEAAPVVMRFIRDQVRRRGAAGPSLPQFRAMSFLSRVKNASLSAAAEHSGLSLPAMSRLIHGLVNQRLVARQTVSTNRRQIALTLTVKGRATVEQVRGEIRRRLAASLRTLPEAEQATVQRAMRILHRVFDYQIAAGNLPQEARR